MIGEASTLSSEAGSAPLFVGLGELIWDLLPTGRELGGAPSNFAHFARLLGARGAVATRVGDDALGREARARLASAGVSTEHIQVDREHPTGTVGVEVGPGGEPRFRVNENSAWDYLELTPELGRLAALADAVCFGTLGQRSPQARASILGFLGLTRAGALRVFDANLRHSFFSPEMLRRSLELADVVKLNREELAAAAGMLGLRARGEAELCRGLAAEFGLRLVAVTRGASGCLLAAGAEAVEHPGYDVRVVDTIGCGDAFAATLTRCLLAGAPLDAAAAAANRAGAWVAARRGATPPPEPSTAAEILGGTQILFR
ncbi:MAG TPA: PfkB family carbohydrate kinase [Pyrinomonadaceae bacterium]|nr:PfkB family carbohydrate kinase [Pyrinomonadaceae bacterium]